MKTILVPTDFSEPATWATEAAIGIAKRTNATIILLHVVEQLIDDSFSIEDQTSSVKELEQKRYTLKQIEKSKQQLQQTLDNTLAAGVEAKSELRAGSSFHGIRTIISEYNADLVVIGTAEKSEDDESESDLTAEKVVRYLSCPVLTIHQKPQSDEYKNIVYATSLSNKEKPFAENIKWLQQIYNATVHVLWVNTPTGFQSDHNIKKELQTFVNTIKLENYTLNTYSAYSAEEGVIHFADLINADIITMATQGRTGLAQLLARSIAENVVRHAVKPVLTRVIKD